MWSMWIILIVFLTFLKHVLRLLRRVTFWWKLRAVEIHWLRTRQSGVNTMAKLDEKSLDHIFGFLTPIDWIKISEVSQLWKSVAQKQWEKCNTITFLDGELFNIMRLLGAIPVIDIPADDVEKFVLHLAPFCEGIKGITIGNNYIIAIGPYKCKLIGCTPGRLLKLFAKHATKIKEVDFIMAPKTESLKPLFNSNKIKKLKVSKTTQFWTDISTKEIEVLDVCFEDPDKNFKSFEGHFPKLQKLRLGIQNIQGICQFRGLLSKTLPFVPKIKSLNLYIEAPHPPDINLMHVAKCSDLEELSLVYQRPIFHGGCRKYPNFDEQLKLSSFSKLRDLKLRNFIITDTVLKSMLLIPNLEKLDVDGSSEGFCSIKQLPKLNKLTEFKIKFWNSSCVNMENLCNAVQKMPKLLICCVKGVTEDQMLELTCAAIVAAAHREKDVVIEECSEDEEDLDYKKVLKVENKKTVKSTDPVLYLRFIQVSNRKFFNIITKLVRKQLKNYRVLKLKDY